MTRVLTLLTLAAVLVPLGASRADAGGDYSIRLGKGGLELTKKSNDDRRHRAGDRRRDRRRHDRARHDDRRGRDHDRSRAHDRDRRGRDHDRGRAHNRGRRHHDRSHAHGRRGGVVIRIGSKPDRRWVPGHYETEIRRVRLPDRYERVWVPDRYEICSDRYGRRRRVLVEAGHYETRRIPGRVVTERVRVWVPGYWERC